MQSLTHSTPACFVRVLSPGKAHLAQLVGAEEPEHNVVDAHAFLEGLCGECLEEHESTKAVTLEDIAHTEEEALNLVSRSVVLSA